MVIKAAHSVLRWRLSCGNSNVYLFPSHLYSPLRLAYERIMPFSFGDCLRTTVVIMIRYKRISYERVMLRCQVLKIVQVLNSGKWSIRKFEHTLGPVWRTHTTPPV